MYPLPPSFSNKIYGLQSSSNSDFLSLTRYVSSTRSTSISPPSQHRQRCHQATFLPVLWRGTAVTSSHGREEGLVVSVLYKLPRRSEPVKWRHAHSLRLDRHCIARPPLFAPLEVLNAERMRVLPTYDDALSCSEDASCSPPPPPQYHMDPYIPRIASLFCSARELPIMMPHLCFSARSKVPSSYPIPKFP